MLLGQHLPELTHEPRFADACIAKHRHEPRSPLLKGLAVGAAETLEFLIAADERTCEATHPARAHEREGAHDATRYDPARLALRINRRRPLELERTACRGDGALADKNRAGGCSLLQPRGDVDRIAADEGASCTSLPDDHVARVDPDPQL